MKKSPKESTIVRSILDELRTRGRDVWFRKNHGGPFGMAGVPDIEVIFSAPIYIDGPGIAFQVADNVFADKYASESDPGGMWRSTIAAKVDERIKNRKQIVTVFLEVKKPGEKPTKIQEKTIAAIKHTGAYACVVFSKTEAIEYLENLGLPPKKKE